MKVLHVYKAYFPENITGVPRMIDELAEGLSQKDVESHILALYALAEPERVRMGRHFVHKLQRHIHLASTSFSFSLFFKFKSLIRDVDIVHYHFPWPMGDLLYLLFGRHKPSIVTYHSDIVRQRHLLPFYAPLMHAFLSRVDRIVVTSKNYLATSDVLERYRQKTKVIPIGLSDRALPTRSSLEKWRKRVGEGFFLFVGTFRYYKGLPFLMQAARQNGLPIVIAGEGNVEKLDAPENVIVVGPVNDEDREALLTLCKALVLPSHLRSEAFGVVLLEASRAGKPMISCEIGTGTSYVNVNDETGFVVRPADPQALSQAMSKLAHNEKLVSAMGKNARARYEELFRAEQMCTEYFNLYQHLAEEPR